MAATAPDACGLFFPRRRPNARASPDLHWTGSQTVRQIDAGHAAHQPLLPALPLKRVMTCCSAVALDFCLVVCAQAGEEVPNISTTKRRIFDVIVTIPPREKLLASGAKAQSSSSLTQA